MMNKNKIIYRSFFVILVILGLMIGSITFAKEGPKEEKDKPRLAKTMAWVPDIYANLNINNLWMWDKEDGMSNFSPTDHAGCVFPRGTMSCIYKDGLVWGARAYIDAALTQPAPFSQPIRTGGSTYSSGCRPGWIEGFGADAVQVPQDHPDARIWKIRRDWKETYWNADGSWSNVAIQDAAETWEIPVSDVTDTELQTVVDNYEYCWNNWPVYIGAPFIDRNGNGVYDPPPAGWTSKSLIADNLDEPGISGADPNSPADMVLWYVYNDILLGKTFKGSEPTGIELQSTVWGYNRGDALGNMYFRKARFINKGGVEIDENGTKGVFYLDSCYVLQWSDPDLGEFGDDLVGCDTVLSMGYVYNGNAVDNQYKRYNLPPPSVGYDFLQGPALPTGDPNDVAVFDLKYKPGFKNLGMTGFSYFSAGGTYSDPIGSWETNAVQWYKMMRGFAPLDGPDQPYRHPPGVTPGKFPLAGNPVTGTGHIDGLGTDYSYAPGDRRLLCITGPWTMAPGDTQEVVVALVAGLGADRKSSISVMKFNDRFAQNTYDALFQVSQPPPSPTVVVSPDDGNILLEWASDVAKVKEIEETVSQPGSFKFQGYNIYQLPTKNSTKEDAKRIATYDVVDEFTVILDDGFDVATGQVLTLPVQFGGNTGIKRQFTFDQDYISGVQKITNGKEYYLAVTAYSVSAVPGFLPKTLESTMDVHVVVSQIPFGEEFQAALGDTVEVVHDGISDGMVYPVVVDPAALTGHDYKVTFTDADGDGETEWTLTDVTTNSVLNFQDKDQSGGDQGLFYHGMQIRVLGAPLSVKNFLCTANANGPLDPPEAAAAPWYDFPTPTDIDPDGYVTDRQQVGAGKWMIDTHKYGSSNYRTFQHFLDRSFVSNGIGAVIPNDLEIRFTAAGTKLFDNWGAEAFIDAPFEVWHTGMDDNPADDYKLLVYMLDNNGNGPFDMAVGADYSTPENADHGVSGGTNDPFTDRMYIMAPTDNTPGTQGYDNLVASIENDPANRPGWNTSIAAGAEAWTIVTRLVLVNWNGGDVLTATSPADYNQAMPEVGTILKIQTTKPNTVNDVFTFTSPAPKTDLTMQKSSAERVGVFPNPYFAANPLETHRLVRFVTFNNLPHKATIRIFNLAGHLIKVIEKDDDTQFSRWDILNQSMVPVASGIYVAYIEMPEIGAEKILKLAIVQEAEVLPVY